MQGFKRTHGLKFARTLRKMGVKTAHTSTFHLRDGFKYKNFRRKVLKNEPDGKCFICRSRKATQAHHLAAFSQNPDKRFDVDNGRGICKACHKLTHSYGSKLGNRKKKPPAENDDG